ncbi:MAG: ABC transporter permease [Blastocatellia bacterium]|nr:ABC transporter permease [Blastocatellia bacterium]
MRILFQDLQYALRLFRKKPGFTVIAVLTLAIGIGANTAVFSVVNAFLLRPLPYREPDRLVMIQRTPAAADYRSIYSYPVFSDVREQSQSFEGVAAFGNRRLTFDTSEGPEIVFGSGVTSNLFSVLGVAPMLGRAFLPGEDEPNKTKLVILSHGLWQRRFGRDPNIIGQTITADKETVEIIGVMPPDLKFDLMPDFPKVEFWMPISPRSRMTTSRNINWLRMIARLKPEASLTQARTELDVIAERIRQNAGQPSAITGGLPESFALSAIALKQFFVGDAQKPLMVLLGAVAFVLLIACVNVANLLLAHGVGRQKEIAIRAVLGANRRRLMGQMLTESLLLSFAGGLSGLLLVTWLLQAIVWLTPKWMVRMEEISLDRKVFLFTLGASLLTGILFGLLPSLYASKVDLQSTLKSATATAGSVRRGFRSLLVITEVALALVLLVGAGLLINSFVRLTSVDLGFDTENVLGMNLTMLSRPQAAEQLAFDEEALNRVQALSGVREAALIDSLPVEGGKSQTHTRSALLEGPLTGQADAEITIESHFTTPGYFQMMGIKLVKGRLFTDADTAGTEPVVVISERLAREAWPGEDPIGKQLLWNWAKDQRPTVIGVVKDVRRSNLSQEPISILYAPLRQNPDSFVTLVIRASTDAVNLTPAVRQQILSVDSRVVVDNIMTIEQRLGEMVAQPRFYAVLLGWFGAMGMLLSMIGLYGVISYSVNQATREIGIRMALGAQSRDILKLVLGQGMILTAAGLGIGVPAAYGLTRFLESLLFNVSPTDPVTFAFVSLLLAAVALLACYIPARRAARVDPMVALRYE